MPRNHTAEILERSGSVITGRHFVYASAKHGPDYIDKRRACRNPHDAWHFGREFAYRFKGYLIEAVVVPAYGAIPMGYAAANHLTSLQEGLGAPPFVPLVIAEKEGDGFVIPEHSIPLIRDKRVLVIEDILTTGGSVRKVVDLVRSHGGSVTGVGALVNRGGVSGETIGVEEERLDCLLRVDLPMYPAEDCPLCEAGVPVETELGHGKAFLAATASAPASPATVTAHHASTRSGASEPVAQILPELGGEGVSPPGLPPGHP